MNSYFLRINHNHVRKQIEQNFLGYRDILFRGLILNLVLIHHHHRPLVRLTAEDSHYDMLLKNSLNAPTVSAAILQLGVESHMHQILDTTCFVEEFILSKYQPRKMNYLSMSIDSGFHSVIQLKQV